MAVERDRLVAVARLYADAVAIVDPLRIRLWTECGLTMPQLRLMLMLREEPGMTGGAIADRLDVNPSTITGHVEKLLQRGLSRREEDLADRRVQHNFLTEPGVDLVGRIERVAGHFLIDILSRLDSDQIDRLQAGLGDLVAAARTRTAH